MPILYCLGKASRFAPFDVSPIVPYEAEQPSSVYEVLRMAVYPNLAVAERAAQICETYNPVGFVVLIWSPPDV